ncbi:reverse transcriptase domain-containing protein [Tanacetum coccineum]
MINVVASEDMGSLTFEAPKFLCHLMDPSSRNTPVMDFDVLKVLVLGLDKIKGSDMTVHNSNLQMDGDDQDSSTVIIGYCPDMFPSVVAISWCPHDSSYLLICAKDDHTILWDTISVEIASELPVGTNLNLDEHWHPKLHGVISASSFHGKIGIYNIEPCTRYSVGKDSEDKVAENASNKRKWEGNHNGSLSQQNKGHKVPRAHTTRPINKKAYAGSLPLCNQCKFCHNEPCTIKCRNCKKVGHITQNCRTPAAARNQRTHTCYECRSLKHYKSECLIVKFQNRVNMIHGRVIASKPKTMQDAIKIAIELMGKKINTLAECQAQQQPTKKQGVAIADTAGPGEKKEYAGTLPSCNKCKFHHNGQCTVKCANCKRVGHLTRDYRSPATTNNQRNLTCYECVNQGHYRSDCPERKNQNHENQTGGTGARGVVHALGGGETDQDPNNIKDKIEA